MTTENQLSIIVNERQFYLSSLNNSKISVVNSHGDNYDVTPERINDNAFVLQIEGKYLVIIDNIDDTSLEGIYETDYEAILKANKIDEDIKRDQDFEG